MYMETLITAGTSLSTIVIAFATIYFYLKKQGFFNGNGKEMQEKIDTIYNHNHHELMERIDKLIELVRQGNTNVDKILWIIDKEK